MNRRGFLGAMLRAGVAAMALPAAKTYARIWSPPKEIIPVRIGVDHGTKPETIIAFWYQEQRYSRCYDQAYLDALNAMITKKDFQLMNQ